MEVLRKLEPLALLVMIIAALNWALIALFDTNLISDLFDDETVVDVIYVLFGVCALVWVPRLLDELHLDRRPHPRGV